MTLDIHLSPGASQPGSALAQGRHPFISWMRSEPCDAWPHRHDLSHYAPAPLEALLWVLPWPFPLFSLPALH